MFGYTRNHHSSLAHSDVFLQVVREFISSLNKCPKLREIVLLKMRRKFKRRGNCILLYVFRIRGGSNLLGEGSSDIIREKGN